MRLGASHEESLLAIRPDSNPITLDRLRSVSVLEHFALHSMNIDPGPRKRRPEET